MAIDPKKWTVKTQEAFAAAIDQAKANSQPRAHARPPAERRSPTQDGTVVAPVLAKLGQSPGMVRDRAQAAVDQAPERDGGDEPRMSSRAHQRHRDGRAVPQGPASDDYVSVEHLLLAMNDRLGVGSEELLQVLRDVRGSHRVTDQNPEEKFAALEKYGQDLTGARGRRQDRPGHRPRRRDPPRDPGALAGAPRTTRC